MVATALKMALWRRDHTDRSVVSGALGAQQNVVVEVRTCSTPDATTPGYSDPSWARSYAERVPNSMLKNIVS